MELDQALFGYDRGHHLIASSRKFGKEATWVLRNVTDMKVTKRNGHYLTVLPVPELGAHAFIRTWLAGGGFRPGSVWSHALLVPASDLDKIEDLRVLLGMFTRPQIHDPDEIGTLKPHYTKKVTVPVQGDADLNDISVDGTIIDRLVLAAYDFDAPASAQVVVDDARPVEAVVLGLMSQRWAHLRRRFSARTRYRPSQTSAAQFALEIVERGSGTSQQPSTDLIPAWAFALGTDLRQPNQRLRLFLRMHTGEMDDEPSDIAKLTDVFVSAAESPNSGVQAVAQWFPLPTDSIGLKRDLFGLTRAATPISDTWPMTDPERLQLLLRAPTHAFALQYYDVGTRLANWARIAPVDAAVAIIESDVAQRGEADLNELVAGIATGFDTDWVGKLVGTFPRLAPTLLAERPDVWCSPEVWTTEIDHELLIDLITQAEPEQRRTTFLGLLSNGLASSAGEFLYADPGLWWAIVEPDHAPQVANDQLALAGARRLAFAITNSRGPCPWPITMLPQAIVIASVSDPDEGLWRLVGADLWVETYKAGFEPTGEDMFGSVRRDVMALAAAGATSAPATRRLLWSLVFARLHQSLFGSGTPLGCERTLATLLPDGPSWDWCGRLRYGLAKTAVTDGWSDAELRKVAGGAGDFAHEVIAAAEWFRHRDGRSILDEVFNFFTGWMR